MNLQVKRLYFATVFFFLPTLFFCILLRYTNFSRRSVFRYTYGEKFTWYSKKVISIAGIYISMPLVAYKVVSLLRATGLRLIVVGVIFLRDGHSERSARRK